MRMSKEFSVAVEILSAMFLWVCLFAYAIHGPIFH
jgi:hypothetical protein